MFPDDLPYGQGVRAQVFEVIVRQGMVGAPWREICAGPMRVNNITPEEIQAEIDRRKSSGSGPFDPPVPKRPAPTQGTGGSSINEPKTAMAQLLDLLVMVETSIKGGVVDQTVPLKDVEKIRDELNALSNLMIAQEMQINRVTSEAQLQQDLDRENERMRQSYKPPEQNPPHRI